MATLNCKIAPFMFWLCFLALSFFTTFNGQSQSSRTTARDRQEPPNPLCQDARRGAKVVRERISIAASSLAHGQAVEGLFR